MITKSDWTILVIAACAGAHPLIPLAVADTVEVGAIGKIIVVTARRSEESLQWPLGALLAWTFDMHGRGSLAPRVDWAWRSSYFIDSANCQLLEQDDDLHLLNASLTITPPDMRNISSATWRSTALGKWKDSSHDRESGIPSCVSISERARGSTVA